MHMESGQLSVGGHHRGENYSHGLHLCQWPKPPLSQAGQELGYVSSRLFKMLVCFCSLKQNVWDTSWSLPFEAAAQPGFQTTPAAHRPKSATCQGWPVTPLAWGTPKFSIPCNTSMSQQPGLLNSSSRTVNPVLTLQPQGKEETCIVSTHHAEKPRSTLDLPVQTSTTTPLLVLLAAHLFWHWTSSLPYKPI